MANQIPVKAKYTGSDVTSLGEYTSTDKIAYSYIDTGTTSTTIALGNHTHSAYSATGHNHSGVYEPVITNNAVTDTAQEYTAQQNFNALALTFNATQAWNLSTKQVTSVTLTAAITFSAPTNQKDGSVYVITLIQDGTGSRTAAWNTVFKFAGGTVPTLTTTASAKDILTFVSDGTNMNCIAQVLNVS